MATLAATLAISHAAHAGRRIRISRTRYLRLPLKKEAALMGGPSGVTISSSLYSVFRYSMSAQRSASVSDCVKSWPALLLL